MAHFTGSSGAAVSYLGVDGEWHDLGITSATFELVPMADVEIDPIKSPIRDIIGKTFTMTFDGSALWRHMVGLQLQYNLRELHRNMGRLTRWPNTN